MASFYPPLVKGAPFNRKFFEFQNDPVSYSQFRQEAQLNIAGVDSVINVKEINNAGVQIQNEDLVISSNILGGVNTVITAGTSYIPNFNTQGENLVIQSSSGNHIFLGYNDGDGHIYVNTDTNSNMYIDGGDLIMNNTNQKVRMGTSDLYFDEDNKWNAAELKVSKVNLKGNDLENKLASIDSSIDSVVSQAAANKTELLTSIATVNTALSEQISTNKALADSSFTQVNTTVAANKTELLTNIANVNTALTEQITTNKTLADASITQLISNAAADKLELQNSISNVDSTLSQEIAGNKATAEAAINQVISTAIADKILLQTEIGDVNSSLYNQIVTNQSVVDASFSSVTSTMSANKQELETTINNLNTSLSQTITQNKSLADTSFTNIQSNINTLNVELNNKIDNNKIATDSSFNSLSTQKADVTYVDTKVAGLVSGAPELLNTLSELATAIGNDNNFSSTIVGLIGTKTDKTYTDSQIALLQSDINSKATTVDLSNNVYTLETQIATKADTSYVNSELTLKANQTDVTTATNNLQTQINSKADSATMSSQLALKANQTDLTSTASGLQTQIDTKADLATVTSQLALKANQADLTSTTNNLQSQINAKAATTYVNTQLALKTNQTDFTTATTNLQSQIDTKASASFVSLQLDTLNNTKADKTYVDNSFSNLVGTAPQTLNTLGEIATAIAEDANFSVTIVNQLAGKASKTYVDGEVDSLQTQINDRALASYVNQQLALKGDTTYINEQLALKSNVSDVDTALATKANASDLTALTSVVSGKSDTTYVDLEIDNAKAYADSAITTATTGLASQLYVDNKTQMVKDDILGGASAAYDTLLELQTALTNNSDAVSALTNEIASKASATYVDNTVANLQSNIQTDLNFKASITYVDTQIAALPAPPSLTGYATETYVNTAIQNAQTSGVDLTAYATKNYVDTSIADLSGNYASKTYVDSAVANVSVDLTGYATETFVATAVSTAKDEILGGAGAAYDTLQELNTLIQSGDSSVSTALSAQIALKANDNEVVHLTGTETIGGIKTFSNDVTVPSLNNISATTLGYLDATSSIQTQLNAKANTTSVVNLSTAQTIGGAKTFSSNVTVPSLNNITSTTLGYLDATSSIQTQLNAKATDTLVVHLAGNETITGYKTFNNINKVSKTAEQMGNLTITSNAATWDYPTTPAIAYVTPSSATNFTLNITNIPFVFSGSSSVTVTLLINTSTNKAYANAITVNGTSYTMRFCGGSAAINISSAVWVLQTITILILPGTTVVGGVLSSVTQWY